MNSLQQESNDTKRLFEDIRAFLDEKCVTGEATELKKRIDAMSKPQPQEWTGEIVRKMMDEGGEYFVSSRHNAAIEKATAELQKELGEMYDWQRRQKYKA